MQQKCTKFPERLTELREGANLSRQQLADILGVSRASLEYYEKGKRTPDIDVLYKLSEHFNVTSDYLIGRTDKQGESTDINAICNYTGLTLKAIEELRIIKELSETGTCSDSAIVIDESKLSGENLLFFEQEKAHCKDYLYYISEFILDVNSHTIAIYIRDYINYCQRFNELEKGVITDEYLRYEDAKNYSLFKISKAIQDIIVDLCNREVDNGND